MTSLFYVPGASAVVSASWDRSIVVHDESAQGALLPAVEIKDAHQADITAVTASPPDQVRGRG